VTTTSRVPTALAVALGLFATVVALIAVVLVAFSVGGTSVNVALVATAVVSAGLTALAIAKLRDVARADNGWGTAFAVYALAYVTLLVFLAVLAFSHPMG